ncbi:MAG: hypothetical protein E6K80_08265 [Candidatus Eisenbacteria bacterium]|uniref:Uncharacterized protein n=1 Tax=Eiseniibacteriota bacterium TaxID=2212470 RepID=A0A538U3P4_UNCEI|nr:MAG: hypothetical protein E6K80_08265 [Candidatus Eisenbacteria bacterium]
MLLGERATFPLAQALRATGAPLGEVFSFLSGLYFRGKLAYGRAFARVPSGAAGVLVITPGRGLVAPETTVTIDALRAIAGIGVSPDEPRFREPLARDCARLGSRLMGDDDVVLLGSIATGKYVDVLDAHLEDRLRFPAAFVGRGDMSRGGLMLRCVDRGEPLEMIPVAGSVRHGKRPPRLEPLRADRASIAASAPRARARAT